VNGGIVFLHPIGLDRHVWSGVLPPGAIALNFPGHGDNGGDVAAPLSIAGLADYVLGQLGGHAVTLVGLSLGGMVAQHIAIAAPHAVTSLVVACSTAAADPRVMLDRAALTRSEGMAGSLRMTLDRWFTPQALAAPGHPGVEYARRRLLADDPEIVARYWEAMAVHNVSDQLGLVKVPSTFIAGAADPSSPVEVLEGMARAVPGAVLKVVDGPHMLPLERPQEFSAVLAEHLNRVHGR
jgi:3-oxoadipate enol-lactonase